MAGFGGSAPRVPQSHSPPALQAAAVGGAGAAQRAGWAEGAAPEHQQDCHPRRPHHLFPHGGEMRPSPLLGRPHAFQASLSPWPTAWRATACSSSTLLHGCIMDPRQL